jgi:hypothetical protein
MTKVAFLEPGVTAREPTENNCKPRRFHVAESACARIKAARA